MSNKRYLMFLGLLISFFLHLVIFFYVLGIRVNLSSSAPVGLWKVCEGDIEVGDWVVLKAPALEIRRTFEHLDLLKQVKRTKDNLLWVEGLHEGSFDSRVFGFVPIDCIKEKLKYLSF